MQPTSGSADAELPVHLSASGQRHKCSGKSTAQADEDTRHGAIGIVSLAAFLQRAQQGGEKARKLAQPMSWSNADG